MVVGGLGGALARDELLARAVRRRREELVADLPAVAELLALSVAAGENVSAALDRVAAGGGPLCEGLRAALGRVRTGTPLLDALADLAGRWQVPPFSRFVDALAVAVEAGSPLADVLRAQAADARDAEHRRLTEAGGRQEVAMMVPVVFGILPTVVVFAVYPGLAQLQLTN
nr:type II secretion system F family protein [Kineococcus aurantiacus]